MSDEHQKRKLAISDFTKKRKLAISDFTRNKRVKYAFSGIYLFLYSIADLLSGNEYLAIFERLKMKKDKAFAEKGSICSVGWHIGYEHLEPMTKELCPHMTALLDRGTLYITFISTGILTNTFTNSSVR